MSLARFKQILKAFRTEVSAPTKVRDKAYQLRTHCQCLNDGARKTFILGRHVSFDEGGVASRSRMNPIRMFNKDKPNKFTVEFFMLASPRNWFCYHFSPYEGRNATHNFIRHQARGYATTQRAVMNAVIDSGISNDPVGPRILACDNRYTAFYLFMDLRQIHNIFCVGTIRKNRRGWNSDVMNLPKSSARGSSLVAYDTHNSILCFQWNDNKVVSGLSTLPEYGFSLVRRRVGRDISEFNAPASLVSYQTYMGGVDKYDQIRDSCGGFGKGIKKTHKWFQKILLALMDAGVANASIAHNMFAKSRRGIRAEATAVPISVFQQFLCREMLKFKGFAETPANTPATAEVTVDDIDPSEVQNFKGHVFSKENVLHQKNRRPSCRVCRLEKNMMVNKIPGCPNGTSKKNGSGSRCKHNMVKCATCQTNFGTDIFLHLCQCTESPNRIFKLNQFKGMSCFEIFHSVEGLWQARNGKTYVQTSHPLYRELRDYWRNQPSVLRDDVEEDNGEESEDNNDDSVDI